MGEITTELPITLDLENYDKVLAEARRVFIDRNRVRQSAFRHAGWKGNLVEMRKKLDRLWAVWQMRRALTDSDRDEAIDLINATVFFLLCADADNPDGHWPWP